MPRPSLHNYDDIHPKSLDEAFDRVKIDRKEKVKKRNKSKVKETSKRSTTLTVSKKINHVCEEKF